MTSPKNRNLPNSLAALRELISVLSYLAVVLALVSSLNSLAEVLLLIRLTAIPVLPLLFIP